MQSLLSFSEHSGKLPGQNQPRLHKMRQEALKEFEKVGLPTPKCESWKYTNLTALNKLSFRPVVTQPANNVTIDQLKPYTFLDHACNQFGDFQCSRLVFVDGRFQGHLSFLKNLPKEGITIHSVADVLSKGPSDYIDSILKHSDSDAPLSQLNTAWMQDGAFILLKKGCKLRDPIHLLFVSTLGSQQCASNLKNIVFAGEDSSATIIENYVGLGKLSYFNNVVTDVHQSSASHIHHYKWQHESPTSYHTASLRVQQHTQSRFYSQFLSLGGALVRNEIHVQLTEPKASCQLDGLFMTHGKQHVDNYTVIDHQSDHCESKEIYRGVATGESTGIFNGKIHVRKGAQKTQSHQLNKNLLLSDRATINAKPQLEIYADDVKCSHGSATGQLEEDAVFYLRSRGIGEKMAKRLLTYAFGSEIMERIEVTPLRESLEQKVRDWLDTAQLEGE